MADIELGLDRKAQNIEYMEHSEAKDEPFRPTVSRYVQNRIRRKVRTT
jgi:hypothetical protein